MGFDVSYMRVRSNLPTAPIFRPDAESPQHIKRWMEAMQAARADNSRAAPTSSRTASNVAIVPLVGADLCHRHLGGEAREAYDLQREPELILIANGIRRKGEVGRARALAQLACMTRRRLRRAWKRDPTIEGSTVTFEPHVERQVAAYLLKEHDLDIDDVVAETGWTLTPRARDRCLWAGYFGFTGKSDHQPRRQKDRDAVADDITFYAKLAALEVYRAGGLRPWTG